MLKGSFFRLVILSALVGFTGGCSFTGVKGPPPGHQTMPSFECTEDRTLPIIDGIIATPFIVGAIVGFVQGEPENQGFGPSNAEAATLALGIGGVYGTSSWVGFRRVSACRAAKEDLARRSGELARLRMMAREP